MNRKKQIHIQFRTLIFQAHSFVLATTCNHISWSVLKEYHLTGEGKVISSTTQPLPFKLRRLCFSKSVTRNDEHHDSIQSGTLKLLIHTFNIKFRITITPTIFSINYLVKLCKEKLDVGNKQNKCPNTHCLYIQSIATPG